jgi:hypothetical protein
MATGLTTTIRSDRWKLAMPTALFSLMLAVVLAISITSGKAAIETADALPIAITVIFSAVSFGVAYVLWIAVYKVLYPETIKISRSEIVVTRRGGVITVPWQEAGEPYATMRATGNVSSDIVIIPYPSSGDAQVIIEADDYAGSAQSLANMICAARDGNAPVVAPKRYSTLVAWLMVPGFVAIIFSVTWLGTVAHSLAHTHR